jgi:hypothetical protein
LFVLFFYFETFCDFVRVIKEVGVSRKSAKISKKSAESSKNTAVKAKQSRNRLKEQIAVISTPEGP